MNDLFNGNLNKDDRLKVAAKYLGYSENKTTWDLKIIQEILSRCEKAAVEEFITISNRLFKP